MAKKITGFVKLQIPAGKRSASGRPRVVNTASTLDFAKTQCKNLKRRRFGYSVVITIYSDDPRSYHIPPVAFLLKAAKIEMRPPAKPSSARSPWNRSLKSPSGNCPILPPEAEAAVRTVKGTARSMGMEVVS
jgi:ribosomal protein L11